MRKADVIEHFGSQKAVAKALGRTKAAVSNWPEIIPEGIAYKVQVLTGGKLQVDPSLYRPRAAGGES